MPVTPLEERLLARVREAGPIGFDEFMEAALYDPADGFYAVGGRGPGADFVTSPTLSPLFGATLAQAVTACHRVMGTAGRFTLCEVGSGQGVMLADLLGAAADVCAPWLAQLSVILVERGGELPGDLPAGFQVARTLLDIEPFEGVVVANELLDNLPVRLLAGGEEVRVGERDGRLALVPEVDRHEVDPVGIRAFLDDLSRVLEKGVAILIDFGPRSERGGVRTFSGHRLGEDLVAEPGQRDVTASVDWDRMIEEAGRRGLDLLGRRTQREILIGLGLGSSLADLRAAELHATRQQDVWESLRMRDRWTRGHALVEPDATGGFEVVVLGREMPTGLPWEPGR